jgi:hypothetical protein
MDEIDQYNFYLNFKKEINNLDFLFLGILLNRNKIKFSMKIYEKFIDTIEKSKLNISEKKILIKILNC